MWHLLVTSLEQGCLNWELVQGLQVLTWELAALQGLPVAEVPLPDPVHEDISAHRPMGGTAPLQVGSHPCSSAVR